MEFNIVKDKKVQKIAQNKSEHNAFFTKMIVEDDLVNLRVTVKDDCTEEGKIIFIDRYTNIYAENNIEE